MYNIVRHIEPVKAGEYRMDYDRRLFENGRRCSMEFAHTACKFHLFQKLIAQVAGKIYTQRKERRKHRAAEATKQERHRNHHRHFAENQVDGSEQAERRARTCHKQNAVIDTREQAQVDRDNRQKPKILANDKRGPADGFRQKRKHRTALDFFLHKADAHENRNQKSRKAHHRKRRGLDDISAIEHRPLAKHNAEKRKRNRQKAYVIENLVANGFAERIESNNANMLKRRHGQFPPSKYLRDSDVCGPFFQLRHR